jgi:MSHA biogenesis protein MshQ
MSIASHVRALAIIGSLFLVVTAQAQISTRAASQAGVDSGDLVLQKPAGTNTGDVLVATVAVVPATATVSAPAGWTLIGSDGSGTTARLALYWRTATAADASVSAYTFTFSTAHTGAAGAIASFIGVDGSNPVDVSARQATASAFAHAMPSVTTTARGDLLIGVFAMPGSTTDWQPAPGMVEAADVASAAARPDAAGVALTLGLEPRTTPAATGTRTATADSAGIAAAAGRTAAIALRPALAPANTHYRLDGAASSLAGNAGEVFDSGGTALHGFRRTITAPTTANLVAPNPTIHGQNAAVTGQFCNAAQFDGRAVLEVPANAQFDYTNEFSASAWIFATAAPTGGGLYSVLSNDQNYEFHLDANRRLFWWWGGGARSLTSNAAIPLNQWVHLAITFRSVAGSARQRIYINGVLDTATNNWAGTLTANGCNFYIGGDVSTGAGCGLIADRAFRGNIDEVKLYNYELTAAEVQRDQTIGRNCGTAVSRYRLEHDGAAISCAAESITVRACATADCSSLSNTGASGTVTAGGNSVPFSIPVGQTSTTVSLILPTTSGPPDPEAVRLGVGTVTPVPSLIPSCRNGAGTIDTAAACDVSVADAGFVFDVPNHVSDTAQSVQVRAVQRTAGNACVPLFANASRSVGFWSSYLNPATGTRSVSVNGSTLGAASPGSPISLSFNSNGEANLSLRYPDVGRMRLSARYAGNASTGDAGLVVTGQDDFVARPQDFFLALVSNPAAADENGGVFARAGVPFPVTVTARNASGVTTPNYGRESPAEGVELVSALVAPIGGQNPDPAAAPGFGAFTNGVATGNWRWDEVGIISLTPRIAAAVDPLNPSGLPERTYLGTGQVEGTTLPRVGRFIPARLDVAANTPSLMNACAAGAFGYMGQAFAFGTVPQFTVTGRNALGVVTQNYDGVFWKLAGRLAGRTYANTAVTTATFSRTTDGGDAARTGTTAPPFDGSGLLTVNGDLFTYSKPLAHVGPFDAQLSMNLPVGDLTDSDGACYDVSPLGSCDAFTVAGIAGTAQRWGRIATTNAFGPELNDLRVPMRAEFFNGSAFVPNTNDVCSIVSSASLVDANPSDALLPSETCVQDTGAPGASGLGCSVAAGLVERRYSATPTAGVFTLWLRAPGAGNAGVLDLTPDVPVWLRFNWTGSGPVAPTARVGFGVYQGDRRAIFEREVY